MMNIKRIGQSFLLWSEWWDGQSNSRQHLKLKAQLINKGYVSKEDLYQLVEIIPDALHKFGRPPRDVMETPPTVDEVLELLK